MKNRLKKNGSEEFFGVVVDPGTNFSRHDGAHRAAYESQVGLTVPFQESTECRFGILGAHITGIAGIAFCNRKRRTVRSLHF